MSIHTDRSFLVARSKCAMAALSYHRWRTLTGMSKRELAELVTHLAALASDSYDETIIDDDLLLGRIAEERRALSASGTI